MKKRPFLFAVWTLVLGELCGRYAERDLVLLLIIFVFLITTVYQWCIRKKKQYIWLFLFFIFGILHFTRMEQKFDVPNLQKGEEVQFCGKIVKQSSSSYGVIYQCSDIQMKYHGKIEKIYGDFLLYGIETKLRAGQRILGSGKFSPFEEATNYGQFDQKKYRLARNVLAGVKKVKITSKSVYYNHLQQSIWDFQNHLEQVYQTSLPLKESGIVTAMVTGKKTELDQEIKTLYQEQGIAHILAISGLHIAFVGGRIFRFLRKKGATYFIATVVAMSLVFVYCIMAGQSSSAVRAEIMFFLFLSGELFGRSYDRLTAMGMAALILILFNPYCLTDTAFLLSFGAIIGISVVYPKLKIWISIENPFFDKKNCFIRKWIQQKSFDSFLISLSIQIVTLPIIIHTFYQFPPYSIFLNLIIIPAMSILLFCAMIGGILGIFSLEWGKIFLFPTSIILNFYEIVCRIVKELPFSVIVTGELKIGIFLLYIAAIAGIGILIQKEKYKKAIVFLCCCMLFMGIEVEKPLQIICMDVGQGDGILISTPTNRHYFIDGGSSDIQNVGKYRILPLLHYYGITELDGVILTHFDADHYNGIEQLFGKIKIKRLFLPKLKTIDETYKKFEKLAKTYHSSIFYQEKGDQIQDGKINIRWLAPKCDFQFEDKNDNSQVFEVTYGKFKGLFTGDMGEAQEKQLLLEFSRCTFLKVGHHGSKNSSSEAFLEKVRPQYSCISYGKANRYGHPHRETVERLDSFHTKIYETGKNGAILLKTDGKKIQFKKYHENTLKID